MNKETITEVIKELNHIKEHATKEEIAKLNINTLNRKSSSKCIYGQMTGHCESSRAIELYPKSQALLRIDRDKAGDSFTILEKYLSCTYQDTHAKLLAYLKGEIDEIDLDDDEIDGFE